jgi:hypothetical protein
MKNMESMSRLSREEIAQGMISFGAGMFMTFDESTT